MAAPKMPKKGGINNTLNPNHILRQVVEYLGFSLKWLTIIFSILKLDTKDGGNDILSLFFNPASSNPFKKRHLDAASES